MNCKIEIIPRLLHFKQPAGTSRGTYTTRKVWYLHFTSPDFPGRVGIGECAPLPALSCDDLPDYEDILVKVCRKVEREQGRLDMDGLCDYPSILFGLETAIRHFFAGNWALCDTAFSRGEVGIPINGLIWMGDFQNMLSQIEKKMEAGFRCIKLKIGAINFEEELTLLRHIRTHFSSKEIELRVDANGAFSPVDRKQELLSTIRPQYIVIKPSLHGGICGGDEWITEAEKQQIGWWITSALESNIGLNAIAQWCATFSNPLPQGLGTGALFTDNVEVPLEIRKDCLWFCK